MGQGADWVIDRLRAVGVETGHVARLDGPTGHAVIYVDHAAENSIVLVPGANARQDDTHIAAALAGAGPADSLLLQNETTLQAEAASLARQNGLRVIYSAAPFDLAAVQAVLPHLSILVMNEIEAAQLTGTLWGNCWPICRSLTSS